MCRRHAEAPHPDVRFRKLRGFALGKTWRMWCFARAVERLLAREPYDLVFGLGKTWSHDVMRLGGGLHRTYLELAHRDKLAPWKRPFAGLGPRHRLALWIEQKAIAKGHCRLFITNAKMVAGDLSARYGVDPARIRTVYNGVDLARFGSRAARVEGARLRASLGWESQQVVLFLGTGYGRKGLDLLLDAWPALAAERPEARLMVVGFEAGEGRFRARARALGITDQVRFLGGRKDPENAYAAADLYALPTRYDPFANSTLEALASGLPTITSRTNGGSELIEERVQGSVIDLANRTDAVQALSRELVHWCQSERLREGRSAARLLAEQHGIDSKMQETESLLIDLAAQCVPSTPHLGNLNK